MQDVTVLQLERDELPEHTLRRSQRVAAHQGLVYQIVNRLWRGRLRGIYWIDYEDVVQWAQAGLLYAVDNYCPGGADRPWASFYTYAYHCIHGYALNVFSDDTQITKWNATFRRQSRGRSTTYEALPSPAPTFLPFDFLEHSDENTEPGFNTFLEFEINKQREHTELTEDSELAVLRAEAWDSLDRLTQRERDVLVARAHEKTLDQIGEELGVSRERVRQIEKGAINKLRAILTIRRAKRVRQ